MNKILPASESTMYTASCYREILDRVGVVLSFTRGVSMKPLILQGRNYVAIQAIDGEPKVNDILLFEQIRRGETACILHRLIRIEGDVYVTRGDNCLGCERIRRQDIIGRVTEIYTRNSEKKICMTDKGYLQYVRFWNTIWPLRRIFYLMRAFAAKTYHFLIK